MSILTKSVDLIPWRLRNKIRKIPVIAPIQQVLFKKFLTGKEFDYTISAGPAKGLNYRIRLPEDKLLWTGTWEAEICEVIAQNVRTGSICLDVGSHRGFVAGVMAVSGAAEVICFEPNPENIKSIELMRDMNPNLSLCIQPYALSNRNGTARFSLMPESSMGKLADVSFQADVEEAHYLDVEVRQADELLSKTQMENISLIKIDVEGAELDVLKGLVQTIKVTKPIFVIEVHTFELAHACRHYLEELDYQTSIIENDRPIDNTSAFRVCHLLAV